MKKKILVIDDEVNLCTTIKARLEANGFDVLTTFNGEEGLEKAQAFKPDLIILDLMMPKMDGFEICELLKKNTRTSAIPIIVLTALDKEDAAMKSLSLGAKAYVIKPFEWDSLLSAIKEFLE